MLSRRSFLGGILAAAAAPAIVKAQSLMPIWRPQLWVPDGMIALIGADGREIRGNGYERQRCRPGHQDVVFPTATGSWGVVTHALVGGLLVPINSGQGHQGLFVGNAVTAKLTFEAS